MADSTIDEGSVLTTRQGALGIITLNRPTSINALDHTMVGVIESVLRDWETDDAVGAVVVRGAGERGLCAGGDIIAIHRDGARLSASAHTDRDAAASATGRFWHDEYRLNLYIANYPKPYIAIMDGIVMGGGVGISAHGNTRVVTDRTRLAMPEVGIGFIPDVGGTHLLSRVPDQLGTYLALTTDSIDGAEAIALGLADHYLPAQRIDEFVAALTDRPVDAALAEFATRPPTATLDEHRRWIAEAFAAGTVAQIVDTCRGADSEFAAKAAARIASKSPAALAVTLRSLRVGASTPTLADSLRREYRVSLRSLLHPDLAEGIRAQVVDKDRRPIWQPAEQATDELVDDYLRPLTADLELTFESDALHT